MGQEFGQQLSYGDLGRGIHGAIATLRRNGKRGRTYAKLRHQVTLSLGGADNGLYSYQISTPQGLLPLTPVTVQNNASSSTVDAILTALALDHNNNDRRLLNVARAVADLPNDDLVIQAVRNGEPFTVTIVGNPNTNLSQSTDVNANPVGIQIGYAVVDIDGENCRPPTSGDTASDILGIHAFGRPVEAQDDGTLLVFNGDDIEVVEDGDMWIMPEVDMAVGDNVFVRVVATGAEIAGAIRNDADGSDAVQMTRWKVRLAGGPTSGLPIKLAVYP